ncbi:MAG TPA: threonine synthase [Chitinispirillaceae bacterium]|nr:threonine synthase [Chitinispirillaceae bacterium]
MFYISTRGNHLPVPSSQAISMGMVPQGGLFVPESIPNLNQDWLYSGASYQSVAREVFSRFLTDFTPEEIDFCISKAYNSANFGSDSVTSQMQLKPGLSILELWHGPTAAFKDVALQIMPHLLQISKKKNNNTNHTAILVATSGDTGKAALEGFKNCEDISIMVFFPHEGVSEIQRLQMVTTDGSNTAVFAVRGNFDDCQSAVKKIFSDHDLKDILLKSNIELSSANSINWGRLCPQIVYYVKSYMDLVVSKQINPGEMINFCVPTGNFGNILAAYYARAMGVPIKKLICASNKNRILPDFFNKGIYDSHREFYRTNSPSMDILISSNLERFLFEITAHNAEKIYAWYKSLNSSGKFEIDATTRQAIESVLISGWIDEDEVLSTIGNVYKKFNYVVDTHTAVGIALCNKLGPFEHYTVVTSTASPFKFSCDVLKGIDKIDHSDEFDCIRQISSISNKPVHHAVDLLGDRPVLHQSVIEIDQMKESVLNTLEKLT